MIRSTIPVLAMLLTARLVTAEVMVGESLEWLVDSSTDVGIYQVTESPQSDDRDKSRSRITLEKKTTLKGDLPKTFEYIVQDWQVDNSPIKKSHELLVFVS